LEEKGVYTRRAGLGPWTQAADAGERLQLLLLLGHDETVLAEIVRLSHEIDGLPITLGEDEAAVPWNVREAVWTTGCRAARELERWDESLGFNDRILESQRTRGAPALAQAKSRFNAYYPLLRLGQKHAARGLLRECRDVFEAEHDMAALGKTFSALANVEDQLAHQSDALDLEKRALAYLYAAGDIEGLGMSHFNLANYLSRAGQPRAALAHRLAVSIIRFQLEAGDLVTALMGVMNDLANLGDGAYVFPRYTQVCDDVGEVGGVRLAALVEALPRRVQTGEEVLDELLAIVTQAFRSRTKGAT
jgi:tetratricopeptide (TPR) repeat protein